MIERRTRRGDATFWIVVLVAAALKLWLLSPIAINPQNAGHDYTNFLSHAHQLILGHWFGPYDDLTLIKGPMFPLYLAATAEIGIPVPFAHALLYATASLAVCIAIRPLVRSGAVLGAAYVVLLFNPFTYCYLAWYLNRSQLMDSIVLFAIAAAVGIVVRARASLEVAGSWLLALGLATAGVSLTREDSPWIYAPLLVALGSYLAITWTVSRFKDRVRLALAAIPLVAIALCDGTIMAINHHEYGWATTVETTSPAVTSAYQSIARIVVPGMGNRIYPAPEAAREKAYAVSPAAAELKPYFDSTHKWKAASCEVLGDCDDVAMGWFIFALRDAVQGAGYYKSGETARAFYERMSAEIDAACDAGRLACRPKSFGLAPNVYPSDIPDILRYAVESASHAVTLDQYTPGSAVDLGPNNRPTEDEYRIVAGSAAEDAHYVQGWIIHPPDSVVSVTTVDPVAGDPSTDPEPVGFERSADVRSAFGSQPQYRNDDLSDSRFTIATSCTKDCYFLVREGKRSTRIPLSTDVVNFHAPDIYYHLDGEFDEPPAYFGDAFKVTLHAQLASFYQQVVRWWALLVVVLFVTRCVRMALGKRSYRSWVVLLSTVVILAAIAAHCLALGLVSAVSFYALFPEYQISIFPMLAVCLVLQSAVEGDIAYRWFRRKLATGSFQRTVADR